MPALYFLNVTVHVLAAIFWLGGMFFFAAIGAPVLRGLEPPALRQRLFREMGLRFRRAGWWTLCVLIVTGIINLSFRGWLRWDGVLGDADFWRTGVGHVLALKLGAVLTMLVVSAIHDFVLGPRSAAQSASGPPSEARRRRAALLARANAMIGVLIVVAAVRLARGG